MFHVILNRVQSLKIVDKTMKLTFSFKKTGIHVKLACYKYCGHVIVSQECDSLFGSD